MALRDPEARVFAVRTSASAEFALFLRNAEAVLGRGDKDQSRAWALLMRPWQEARDAARRQNSSTADLDALLGSQPPPVVDTPA